MSETTIAKQTPNGIQRQDKVQATAADGGDNLNFSAHFESLGDEKIGNNDVSDKQGNVGAEKVENGAPAAAVESTYVSNDNDDEEAGVAPPKDNTESFGEFVASFNENTKEQRPTELEESAVNTTTQNGDSSAHVAQADEEIREESAKSEPDTIVAANDDLPSIVDSESKETDSKEQDESGSSSSATSVSEEEEEGTSVDSPTTNTGSSSSEGSASDVDVEGKEEEEEVNANDDEISGNETEPLPSAETTAPESGTDFETYEQVAALIQGMNSKHIDWAEAQRMVANNSNNDAIVAAFQALLLHPQVFKGDSRVRKNECKALRAWIRAQDLGLLDLVKEENPWALLLKGVFCQAEDKDNVSIPRKCYELAAQQGNASAQNNLASLYWKEKQYDKALELYKAAAVQGHANAQCALGDIYLDGKGSVEQDTDRAVLCYFDRASKQGHAWAQYKLGMVYKEGADGIDQDFEKAKHYYEMAVKQGFAMAQCNLASMYVKGEGVPVDYERARHLYELSVAQGCAEAQCNLGHLYKNGMGVEQDVETAKELYELAAKQGYAPGRNNLDNLSQESCVIS